MTREERKAAREWAGYQVNLKQATWMLAALDEIERLEQQFYEADEEVRQLQRRLDDKDILA